MTPKPLYDREQFRPFNLWLNDQRHGLLDPVKWRMLYSDLDFVVLFNERTRSPKEVWFYLLEVKTHGSDRSTPANAVTRSLLNHACRAIGGEIVTLPMWSVAEQRLVRYFGSHFLVLSGTSPEDSSSLLWDGQLIEVDTLVRLLRFQVNPLQLTEELRPPGHQP